MRARSADDLLEIGRPHHSPYEFCDPHYESFRLLMDAATAWGFAASLQALWEQGSVSNMHMPQRSDGWRTGEPWVGAELPRCA